MATSGGAATAVAAPPVDALAVRGVTKTFNGVAVLRAVDLTVPAGEVFCLAGANGSGKSTLIKIIAGALAADAGTVALRGHDVSRLPAQARIERGLSVIYQDFSLLPNLSVFENVTYLDRISRHARFAGFGPRRREAANVLARMGVALPLEAAVEDLPVASKQLVAIARALANRSSLIIMDEPTSALTRREVARLFQLVRALRAEGISFLFVSHKLEEIYEICAGVTVLRNGEVVAAGAVGEFDSGRLSEAITGRRLQVERLQPPAPGPEAPEVLRADRLSRPPHYRDVSFALRAGEVFGLTGLLGSGRTELALSLAGLNPPRAGRLEVAGAAAPARESIRGRQRRGVAYVPEDRLTEGLFAEQSIFDNMLITGLGRRTRGGILDHARLRADGQGYLRQLTIKARDGRDPVQTLSGGNQQRVLLARSLDLSPRVLVLNGPTVGVDVGSKHDIHVLIAELARRGAAVVVVSDDLPELLGTCHRVGVMVAGELRAIHAAADVDLETLSREVTQESGPGPERAAPPTPGPGSAGPGPAADQPNH